MKLNDAIAKYFSQNRFFHFTDERNIASIISAGGILSLRESQRLGVAIPAPGGNELSRKLAVDAGLDDYVSLCFRNTHRMEYAAKARGHIKTSRFLPVSPDVLSIKGVRCTLEVSNKSGAKVLTLEEACQKIDFQVLYEHTEWG